MPDIQEKVQSFAFDIMAESPTRTADFVKEEIQRWGDVIHKTGIKIE
jgi:tripartite-type tricarboxylate transporter receptor subunit TctC